MNARSNNNSFGDFIFVVFFIGIIIIAGIIADKKEKKRKQEIMDYCKNNGLVYSETAQNVPAVAKRFSILNHGGMLYAEMFGNRDDYSFNIFDYHYVTGSGKSRQDHYYTICVVSHKEIKIPQFFMRDENFIFDSFGKLFGGQDINFSDDPKYSKMFVLQGKSEPLIRSFFVDRIRKVFVNQHISGFRYEANLNCFMVAAPDRMPVKKRMNLLSKTMIIFNELVSSSKNELA